MFTFMSKEEYHLNSIFVALTHIREYLNHYEDNRRVTFKIISATHQCIHSTASARFQAERIQDSF